MLTIPVNCTGCTACICVCPKGCFSAGRSDEGFMIPAVDANACIECGLCEKVCPAVNPLPSREAKTLLVGQNRDEAVLKKSSSGGIFFLIANSVLERGGCVYGVECDHRDDYKIKHVRIANRDELGRILGSKYAQSSLEGIFPLVKEDLANGFDVLFSGTPCQIAGLRRFLGREWESLTTVDLVCHGVPSPEVWEKYIAEAENEIKEKTSVAALTGGENTVSLGIPKDDLNLLKDSNVGRQLTVSFRDKRYGWRKYGFAFLFSEPHGEGEQNSVSLFYNRYEHTFMKGFLADLYLRPSCHDCPVKCFSSGSDLTLADAWGIENYMTTDNLDKGMSLVIPHTDRGRDIVDRLDVVWTEASGEMLTVHNPAALKSCRPHKNRSKFFRLINSGRSVAEAVAVCMPPQSYLDKVIWSIKKRLKQLFK